MLTLRYDQLQRLARLATCHGPCSRVLSSNSVLSSERAIRADQRNSPCCCFDTVERRRGAMPAHDQGVSESRQHWTRIVRRTRHVHHALGALERSHARKRAQAGGGQRRSWSYVVWVV